MSFCSLWPVSGVQFAQRGWRVGVLTFAVGGFGCGRDAVRRSPEDVAAEPVAAEGASRTRPAAAATPRAPALAVPPFAGNVASSSGATEEPALATFDYRTLRGLEAVGFDFGAMALGQSRTATTGAPSNDVLQADPGYASIVAVLSRDLDELVRTDRSAGVGMRFAHRAFDKRWLVSPKFHYELAAVIHRVDRRAFAPATCGELRLVYRLAYRGEVKGKVAASRVPMTVNVVRWINDPGCARWVNAMRRVDAREGEDAASRWTGVGAPLSRELFALTSPKSVEVNLQSVRWPSTVRPSMAGHAEYLLRVFQRNTNTGPFGAALLENTLDVARASGDSARRERLTAWLRSPEQRAAIALGTVQVPNEFLATRAVSVAPHGLARRANRPFSAVLGEGWGGGAEARETLRRLDGLSCPGCHQSRSVAGFHVLGSEPPTKPWDTLALPHSPHFADEQQRRRAYVRALVRGEEPHEHRAPAEHPDGAGGWGSRCGLDGTAGAAFASWTCAPGLTCRAVDDPTVGECLPDAPGVGDACESGTATWDSANRDTIRLQSPTPCGEGAWCERNAVGFPGGMCSSACDGLSSADGVCGGIAVLDSFNACVARGEIFETCLATTTRPGALRRCSHEAACRDDYVCAATEHGAGACLPPYFLFQLRVDGHVY